MELNKLVEQLNKKQNGAFFNIKFKSDLASKLSAESKKNGIECYKIVKMTTRKGIDYDKQKAVKEKVANGKVLTHELPWGNWKKGFEGLLIEHKGNDYVRIYPATNKTIVEYFLNGKKVEKEDLRGFMINSFFTPKEDSTDAFSVNIKGVLEIG